MAATLWLLSGSLCAGSETVHWEFRHGDCFSVTMGGVSQAESQAAPVMTQSLLEVQCGSLGVFKFRHEAPPPEEIGPSCTVVLNAETPKSYSAPGETAAPGVRLQMEPGPTLPCEDGTCYTSPGQDPWVAVLDWNNWHGWSVGATIQSVSKAAVSLYALDDPELGFLGPDISDAHVAAQLCRLVEALEDDVAPPIAPQVINMSFGRLPEPDDLVSGGECQDASLSCQIRKLLDYLFQTFGTIAVSSAGNHKQLLFPAAYGNVISTGSLDLTHFHKRNETQPAWESPTTATALFPGYGLCLVDDEKNPSLAWSAPAGSSYSSAFLSGWLAETLTREVVFNPLSGDLWTPARTCQVTDPHTLPVRTSCRYVLQHGSMTYSSVNPKMILDRLRGMGPQYCSTGGVLQPEPPLPQNHGPTWPSLPASYIEVVSVGLIKPTPEPDPCVPCMGSQSGGGGGGGGGLRALPARSAIGATLLEHLVIDLSDAFSLAPGLDIVEVLLRIGADFYQIDLQPQELDALERGELNPLVLQGLYSKARAQQPSLVYMMQQDGQIFWSSTPMLVP